MDNNNQHELSCACHNPAIYAMIKRMPKLLKPNISKDKNPTKEFISDNGTVFHGGSIYPVVTVDSDGNEIIDGTQKVDAIGILRTIDDDDMTRTIHGKVVAVGTIDEVESKMVKETEKKPHTIELEDNQTIVPGLIESHVHIVPSFAMNAWNDYSPFYEQELRSPYNKNWLFGEMSEHIDAIKKDPNQKDYWLLGRGVDTALLTFPCDPYADILEVLNAEILDKVSDSVPILLISASMHTAYVNTKALKITQEELEKNIKKEFDDVEKFRLENLRKPLEGSGGVLQELEMMELAIDSIDCDQIKELYEEVNLNKLAGAYFDNAHTKGITMLYDAGMTEKFHKVLESINQPMMRIGMAHLIENVTEIPTVLAKDYEKPDETTINRYYGNAKLLFDGSNQGLTGYQSEPYHCKPEDYGICNFVFNDDRNVVRQKDDPPSTMVPDEFQDIVNKVVKTGWPLMMHANGDQTVKYTIEACRHAYEKSCIPNDNDLRSRIEHCSLLDSCDLKNIKELGLTPSFLIGHVGYWGYVFQKNIFGVDRANRLDLCKSALGKDTPISLHTDNDVTPLGPLRLMEQAFTRIMEGSPEKEVLNDQECLTVGQALTAVTYYAAWQCHAEHLVGSLKPGNLADFVILDQNPLDMNKEDAYMKMRYIKVDETWINGEQIYKNTSSNK